MTSMMLVAVSWTFSQVITSNRNADWSIENLFHDVTSFLARDSWIPYYPLESMAHICTFVKKAGLGLKVFFFMKVSTWIIAVFLGQFCFRNYCFYRIFFYPKELFHYTCHWQKQKQAQREAELVLAWYNRRMEEGKRE